MPACPGTCQHLRTRPVVLTGLGDVFMHRTSPGLYDQQTKDIFVDTQRSVAMNQPSIVGLHDSCESLVRLDLFEESISAGILSLFLLILDAVMFLHRCTNAGIVLTGMLNGYVKRICLDPDDKMLQERMKYLQNGDLRGNTVVETQTSFEQQRLTQPPSDTNYIEYYQDKADDEDDGSAASKLKLCRKNFLYVLHLSVTSSLFQKIIFCCSVLTLCGYITSFVLATIDGIHDILNQLMFSVFELETQILDDSMHANSETINSLLYEGIHMESVYIWEILAHLHPAGKTVL